MRFTRSSTRDALRAAHQCLQDLFSPPEPNAPVFKQDLKTLVFLTILKVTMW